jgi:hypothetical protein
VTLPPEQDTLRRAGFIVAAIFGLALVLRGLAALVFPVVFDEVCVMAYGLFRAFRGARAFLFEAPITVSNGITPLWLWLQVVPAALFGETTKAGLRMLPLALGLAAVFLTMREAGALGGRLAAAIGGFLAAVDGPLLFANARGEYSESLLVVLVLLLLRDLRKAGTELPGIRAALWPTLALLAYFGKGVVVWAAFSAYVLLLLAVRRWLGRATNGEVRTHGEVRAAALVLAPLAPPLAWLVAAQAVLFGAGGTLTTDLGAVGSVWTNLRRLTLDYGREAQPFMVGTWSDALFVYTRFDVWPTLAVLAVPAVLALVGIARGLVRGIAGRDAAAAAGALRPLALVLVPAVVLVGKGTLDVRFHLLYWPVLLVSTAAAIAAWSHALEKGLSAAAFAALLPVAVYVPWTQRASPPGAKIFWVLAMVVVVGLARYYAGRHRERLVLAPLAFVMLFSTLTLGPLDWGRRFAWEPSPLASDVPRSVSSFPNADLQLVRCSLGRDTVEEARPFLVRALERHPDDRQTVMEVAETLVGGTPQDARLALGALGGLTRRNPGDAEARALAERAVQAAENP